MTVALAPDDVAGAHQALADLAPGAYIARFTVTGDVRGKGRHRTRIVKTKGGQIFTRAYSDEKTLAYENLVRIKAEVSMNGRSPHHGAVSLSVMAFFVPPSSWSGKKSRAALQGEFLPAKKPDPDNILKAVADGLNGVAYVDDAQVVDVHLCKRYATAAGLWVEVKAL